MELIFYMLSTYGWILIVIICIKFGIDIIRYKKYKKPYECNTFNQVAALLIFFIVTFQIGEFFPINPMFHWPVKKFLLTKDPDGAKIIYYGLSKSRAGGKSVNYRYKFDNK